MRHAYLEVTYHKGRPLAAYYYLPRLDSDSSVHTEQCDGGLVVDFAADGRAIGIEITSPAQLDPAELNRILGRLGHVPVDREDLAPLVA